jgi:hypothetical protein
MVSNRQLTVLAAVAVTLTMASPALAKGGSGGGGGGGGGGGTTTVLPTPAIAPGTFDGIGPGPVYIHDSFGHAQTTRYQQDGKIVDVGRHPEVNGIRAEYGNNRTETWIGPNVTSGAPRWGFSVIGPSDPYEPYTPLQDSTEFGYQDGCLNITSEPDAPDTRPNALLPFAAPTGSASTVSAEIVNFWAKAAIGFSSSGATNANFETSGQAWLELDTTAFFLDGDGIARWTFHTNGLTGPTLSGTFTLDNYSYNRAAVSYDPVNHVAAASINGEVVASVPYTAQTIKYVGLEGSHYASVDNFTVRAGTVTDPMPDSVAAR